MNLALSYEQESLQEAARGALGRLQTIAAARAALEDSSRRPDTWPLAIEAGWPGLLIDEASGGAGLGAFEAMLVLEECGRVLAPHALLGLLPATLILNTAGDELLEQVALGRLRAAFVPARPPSDVESAWTVDPRSGVVREPAPVFAADDTMSGTAAWVPDAPEAEVLVVIGTDATGRPRGAVVEAGAARVEPVLRYDATRSLGHVTLENAPARQLDVADDTLVSAWHLAQALLAAECLGATQMALEVTVEYAKERFAFGRAIGSYQAVKHELTEVLRQLENARSLQYYAGWAAVDRREEFPLAAAAFRTAAAHALEVASRTMINVHGGIGATWEHDAPLFFRRAQLARRLLAGTDDATDRVSAELLAP